MVVCLLINIPWGGLEAYESGITVNLLRGQNGKKKKLGVSMQYLIKA